MTNPVNSIYEKSVGVLPSLVPRIEALVMPITVRTSNAEAHACMYIAPLAYLIYNKVYRRLVITHPWTSTIAMLFDSKWNLPDFYASRTKRQVNAFIIYMFPTVKPLLMSSSSHPLRASALADSHKGRTLHQPIRFRTWLTLANLWRNNENAK